MALGDVKSKYGFGKIWNKTLQAEIRKNMTHIGMVQQLLKKNGFIYFVDEDDTTVDEIGEGYCYFKAWHMKYRIIPN